MRMRIEIRRFIMESNKHVVLIRAPKHEDSYEKVPKISDLLTVYSIRTKRGMRIYYEPFYAWQDRKPCWFIHFSV